MTFALVLTFCAPDVTRRPRLLSTGDIVSEVIDLRLELILTPHIVLFLLCVWELSVAQQLRTDLSSHLYHFSAV